MVRAMGDGNVHNHKRCPLFLVGHGNGALKGNLHFKARGRHSDGECLFDACCGGLVFTDLESFGDSTGRGGHLCKTERVLCFSLAQLRRHFVPRRFYGGFSIDTRVAEAAMKGDRDAVRQLLKKAPT